MRSGLLTLCAQLDATGRNVGTSACSVRVHVWHTLTRAQIIHQAWISRVNLTSQAFYKAPVAGYDFEVSVFGVLVC
jgi:xanthine dehydrogenase molybdopterin-binding subunit B